MEEKTVIANSKSQKSQPYKHPKAFTPKASALSTEKNVGFVCGLVGFFYFRDK